MLKMHYDSKRIHMRRSAGVMFAGVGDAGRTDAFLPSRAVRHIVMKNICELEFRAVTLLSMKAPKKKFKRKRDPGRSFWRAGAEAMATGIGRARTENSTREENTVSRKTRANSKEVARGVLTRCVGIERKRGIVD